MRSGIVVHLGEVRAIAKVVLVGRELDLVGTQGRPVWFLMHGVVRSRREGPEKCAQRENRCNRATHGMSVPGRAPHVNHALIRCKLVPQRSSHLQKQRFGPLEVSDDLVGERSTHMAVDDPVIERQGK